MSERDADGLLECALIAGHVAGHHDRKVGKAAVRMCPPEFEPGSTSAVAWRQAYDAAFFLVPKDL